jgi:ABC-type nitrate/sulfonate/bicarbonate transport system permease component
VGGAIAVAALSGIPLGILWGSKRSWLEIAEPLILYAAVVPKIVIFPVFILFLGIDVHSLLQKCLDQRQIPEMGRFHELLTERSVG